MDFYEAVVGDLQRSKIDQNLIFLYFFDKMTPPIYFTLRI